MKKYLIAAGVTSLLIAAQAMASDAASLVGAPETAVAPAETASAPAAVAPAYSNAPARPLMVAGEADALSASTVAVPVVAEGTASGIIAAVSRVPDRLAPTYIDRVSSSPTQQTGQCVIDVQTTLQGRTMIDQVIHVGKTAEECEALRQQAQQPQQAQQLRQPSFMQRFLTPLGPPPPGPVIIATAVFTAAAVVATNDDPASGS